MLLDIDINKKEYNKITKILKQYSIIAESIEKIKSVYKIKYNDKNYCLKKLKHGNKKILKILSFIEYLKSNSFENMVSFVSVREGKEYIKTKNSIYYMTEWIDGRNCNINDIEELKKAALLLSDFHIKSKGFFSKELKIENTFKNYTEEFKKGKQDILRFKKLIENKKIKTIFDIEYYEAIDKVLKYVDLSIEMLIKSKYTDLLRKAKIERDICHNSFYCKNIIVDETMKMYIIDVDNFSYDIYIKDIAGFIRKIMYKRVYGWDFNVAKEIIYAYSNINSLSKEEYELLFSLIMFPYKFLKLGRKRYYKNKRWDEDKYLRKLRGTLKFIDNQEKFAEKFIMFYELNE
ncbi:MAG: CotS family spore coat protein [Caloramator sp.]|nr:CotS family spore coat protein [Caloramator sp.]